MAAPVKTALEAAVSLAARAEQCSPLLTGKLLKKGFPFSEVRAAVEKLADEGIIDDGRFCEIWLRSQLRSKALTPRRLLSALRAKGIAMKTAQSALKSCLNLEAETSLLERYLRKAGAKNVDKRALRFEGFSNEAVEAVPISADNIA